MSTKVKPMKVCVVCGDGAYGRNFGVVSCEGCKGFFKRSVRKQLVYSCRGKRSCEVTKDDRIRCKCCRLQKCLQMGMSMLPDTVQHERKPLANQFNKPGEVADDSGGGPVSPSSLFGTSDLSLYARQGFQLFNSNSYQDEDESESNGETESSERSVVAKAIETISHGIREENDDEGTSSIFDGIHSGNILPDNCIQLNLVSPGPPPNGLLNVLNVQYVCETSSRLLFFSISWARSLPAFQALAMEMQIFVAQSAWSELFTIGLVQCQTIMSQRNVLNDLLVHLQANCSSSRIASIADHVSKLCLFIRNAQILNLDEVEFAALKSLAMFSPGRLTPFGNGVAFSVSEVQNLLLDRLQTHIISSSDDLEESADRRLNKILLLLPQLRALNSTSMQELFFTNLLGSTQIEMVIPYILKMDSGFTGLEK